MQLFGGSSGNRSSNSSETAGAAPHPLPDYYIAALHKRLMGQTVLSIESSGADVRVYAHCAHGSTEGGGGVTLALINIALNKTVAVTLPKSLAAAPTREEFMLTAGVPIDGAKYVLPCASCATTTLLVLHHQKNSLSNSDDNK